MTELIRSSGLMGIALSNLGLLYSAEAYLVKAASFLVQDFYHSGLVSHLLVSVLHELCGIELKLGRIIMYFNIIYLALNQLVTKFLRSTSIDKIR